MVGNLPSHPGKVYFPRDWRFQSHENGLLIVLLYVGFHLCLFTSFVLSIFPRRFPPSRAICSHTKHIERSDFAYASKGRERERENDVWQRKRRDD
ncbi:hypothetical protein LZ32DRAFT_279224 [Colletotrichum eremochloae]|nr:hypothetical protein LZ32DRAFT_279224 [Colletotrichum eremochloae]